jgi:hypothetical protein
MDMRYLVLAIVLAAGFSVAGSFGASAAPAAGKAISQAADQTNATADVAGGCGRGWHRNRWGRCIPW